MLGTAPSDVVGQFTATASALTGSASYDPWGTITADDLTDSLGYQGEYTAPAAGNVNMHARWYTPDTGGFNFADTVDNPAVGDSAAANPYAYGAGTPLTGTDPSGHCFWDLCIGETEGAIILGTALVSACIKYCSSLSNSLSDAYNSTSSYISDHVHNPFHSSHAAASSSSAAGASAATSVYGSCAEVWSMYCQHRYNRTHP
ncbi:RHS repeat-associated core domain-containing protein, partial [Streptomyces caeni]